jgi:hypothetical protein
MAVIIVAILRKEYLSLSASYIFILVFAGKAKSLTLVSIGDPIRSALALLANVISRWKWLAVAGSNWQLLAVAGSGWQWLAVAVSGCQWLASGSGWQWHCNTIPNQRKNFCKASVLNPNVRLVS